MQEHNRPSDVFAKRLKEIRGSRGLSQTALARLVTDAGRPLSKAALLRIESGERRLTLDEAMALALILGVAPAHLLSPPGDAIVWITDQWGTDGSGLRNWLLLGDPHLLTVPGQRVRLRTRLAFAVETYAQAIVDAKRGNDTAGRRAAIAALTEAIKIHAGEIGKLEDG